MNITVSNDLELGQKLFSVDKKQKNVYKPCTLCNNTRKVEIVEGDRKWYIDCPKCANKQIKGEESSCISIIQYSSKTFEVSEVALTVPRHYCDSNVPVKVTIRLSDVDCSYGRDSINPETMCDSRGNYYFIDSKECSKEVKRLNFIEKQKEKDFLEGVINGN